MDKIYVPKSCVGCPLARTIALDDVRYHVCNMSGEKTSHYWSRMAQGQVCKIRERHEKKMGTVK